MKSKKAFQDNIVKFFGLSQEYRKDLFLQLLDIPEQTQGAFTFTELYNLPIYLRILLINKKNHEEELRLAKKENEAINQTISNIESNQKDVPQKVHYRSRLKK